MWTLDAHPWLLGNSKGRWSFWLHLKKYSSCGQSTVFRKIVHGMKGNFVWYCWGNLRSLYVSVTSVLRMYFFKKGFAIFPHWSLTINFPHTQKRDNIFIMTSHCGLSQSHMYRSIDFCQSNLILVGDTSLLTTCIVLLLGSAPVLCPPETGEKCPYHRKTLHFSSQPSVLCIVDVEGEGTGRCQSQMWNYHHHIHPKRPRWRFARWKNHPLRNLPSIGNYPDGVAGNNDENDVDIDLG